MSKRTNLLGGFLLAAIAAPCLGQTSSQFLNRLSADYLPVMSPADRVLGAPGQMRISETQCQARPAEELRRRIVDIAVQEWGFFGFNVVDQTVEPEPPNRSDGPRERRSFRRFSWVNADESARVAGSIAGYWATTRDGSWILSRQNDVWNGPSGVASRWRDPWSAAFISWVMCEAGMADEEQFRRAIAHHTYIDQAIVARDNRIDPAAYAAYDVGEQRVEPGDLVCSARRPSYRSLSERRSQLGDGIRSHCDIVVKVEPERQRILTIGGNVRGTVSMKLMPARFPADAGDNGLRPESIGASRSEIFAHLKLRAPAIEADAFDRSPTLVAVGELGRSIDRLD